MSIDKERHERFTKKKIESSMIELGGEDFFVKTSSRSPKDATEISDRLKILFYQN